jgi:hypothetical protein
MLSDRKPHGILCFLYREFRFDRYLYFIVATESQPFVGRVLVGYPAYNSPISSCIGAVPPAEPPSRDIKPWGLGQPWIKIRTILSTMSKYCQRGSITVSCLLFASLQSNDIYISPNNLRLNGLRTLSLFRKTLLLSLHRLQWAKGSTPDLHPSPVGVLSECGVWQLRLMTSKQLSLQPPHVLLYRDK